MRRSNLSEGVIRTNMEMTLDGKICGMKMCKLGDLCSDVVDCPHSTPEWKNEGIRVIRNFNIVNGSLDFSNGFFVDEETFEKRTQRACPEFEDLVISREAPMGAVCMIPKNLKCCLGQRLVLLKVNKDVADPNYILFAIQSQFVQKQIQIIDQTGSIVSNLNIPDLKSLRIPLPSLPEQKKIASVLSALDDKIALNKKMNQKLEAMAKRLYDYWFVQYDFPDKNGRPYKTTGGPMTYNPILKREIPAGWEVSSFTDFGFFKNGINYDKNEIGDETVKIVNVRNISDSTTYFNIDELDDITLKSDDIQKFVATPKDILLARSGSPGATRLLPQTDKKIIYCGFIIRYQLNEQDLDKQLYLFHVLKGYEQVTSTQSAGSILKNISQDTLNALMVVMPQSSVLDAFNKKIAPIYSMLRKNICELNKLTALRDKLLPLLMNGQVEIK